MPATRPERMELAIVVFVQEGAHSLDELPCSAHLCRRRLVTGDPRLPGFPAHRVLARETIRYEWYARREDDEVAEDPFFSRKLAFFDRNVAARLDPQPLPQPSRYDIRRPASHGVRSGPSGSVPITR